MEDPRNDWELMAAVAREDEEAFTVLMQRHQGAVYGTIVKMTGDATESEDLSQQVFLRVYRAAPRYEARAEFRTWLFTIVRNLVFNEQKRRQRAKLESIDINHEEEDRPSRELPDLRGKSPAQASLDQELLQSIEKAIQTLPEQQRLAVVLRRYDEFSYEEIAAIMKTSVPAVKSLLFRARETLHEALQRYLT